MRDSIVAVDLVDIVLVAGIWLCALAAAVIGLARVPTFAGRLAIVVSLGVLLILTVMVRPIRVNQHSTQLDRKVGKDRSRFRVPAAEHQGTW
ncbi:MAG: hypothetical protein WEC34_00215 [Acidimicrobiia bacterium]